MELAPHRTFRAEFKVKVFYGNTTRIDTVVTDINGICMKYDDLVNSKEIDNYEVYYKVRGSYQRIATGMDDYLI